MSDTGNVQPIIIRKKVTHGGHHGGAWKVAYADFVTAMMSLFIVLWLMSSSEPIKKAIAGYFHDPNGVGKMMGSDMAGTGESLALKKTDMNHLKEKLNDAFKQLPEFKEIKEHVQMTVTGEGLRIELLETAKGMFFENGNANPSPDGKDLLLNLAHELAKLPNEITIEGHTDSKPYASLTYTNWELSADRANAARRLMQVGGLRDNQVTEVRGFASQRLRKPDDPTDPSNRRISVIVQYTRIHDPAAIPVAAIKEAAPAKPAKPALAAPPVTTPPKPAAAPTKPTVAPPATSDKLRPSPLR